MGEFLEPARRARSQVEDEMSQWSAALVGDLTVDASHDRAALVRRPLREAIGVLELAGDRNLARQVKDELAECESLAVTPRGAVRASDLGDPYQGSSGFLARYVSIAPSRSSNRLRIFGTKLGVHLPFGTSGRGVTKALFVPVNLVRLLHTPDIERRAIVAMLWMRAIFLVGAPLTAAISYGHVPLSAGSSVGSNWLYLTACTVAVITAILAPKLATFVMGTSVRWPLFVFEQVLFMALLLEFPCWACFAFGAGPIVWLEKKDWSLGKLLAWSVASVGLLLFALERQSLTDGLVEVTISVVVVGLIADSYGLMAPAVVTTLISAMRRNFALKREIVSRDVRTRAIYLRSLSVARNAVLRSVPGGDAKSVIADLARVEAQVKVAGEKESSGTALVDICSTAIRRAGVPPADWNSDATLQATQVQAEPGELALLRPKGRKVGRDMEKLFVAVVLEAVAHGSGLLMTRITACGESVEISLANEIHPEHQPGSNMGVARFRKLSRVLPDCDVAVDGAVAQEGLPMWQVRVRLGSACFRQY